MTSPKSANVQNPARWSSPLGSTTKAWDVPGCSLSYPPFFASLLQALTPWITKHVVEDVLIDNLSSWGKEQSNQVGL